MSEDLEKYLKDIGFENLYGLFVENQITTVRALRNLDEESLKDIGLKPLAIKSILRNNQNNQNQDEIGGNNNNYQMVLFQAQNQIATLKKDAENDKKFFEMQHQMELMKKENETRAALQETKTKAEIDSLKQAAEFSKKEFELNSKIMEKEYEGKQKVIEVKLENSQKAPPPTTTIIGAGVYPYYPHQYPYYPADTVLLNPHFFGLIQSWLGVPRHWVLRYRGTRNGFAASNFHAQCNSVGSTITIIRSTNGHLFGGYNPNAWTSSNNYQAGGGSFIFTLTNPYGSQPTPFHFKSGSDSNGPFDYSTYGPTFGGHDIYISNNCNANNNNYTNFPHSYNDTLGRGNTTFAGAYNFTVAEIEVFSV